MIPTSSLIQYDIETLLSRAFIGQTLVGFGEDGCGSYGRSDTPGYFIPTDILAVVHVPDDAISYADVEANIVIALDGYDADITGLLMTDRNIEISINECLKRNHMTCKWWWDKVDHQGRGTITICINVAQLLA